MQAKGEKKSKNAVQNGNPAKRSNATNGTKAHNDNRYIKVGRVRMNSWMTVSIPVADIFISERELVHITEKHGRELQRLGLDALLYVGSIISNSNEIRKGNTHNTFLFIVKTHPFDKDTVMNCAVVELSFKIENKRKVYKIKTAYPAIMGRLSKNELVCVKPRS
ncbi:MAG: hypothetical protein ACI392_00190 [Paludibacteraceae bacterium]